MRCAVRAHRLTPDEIGWSVPPLSRPVARMHLIAAGLARAFVSGPWEKDALFEQGRSALGRKWRWLGPLAGRVLAAFPEGKPLRAARLAEFLRRDPTFQRACRDPKVRLKPKLATAAEPPPMSPAAGPPGTWTVPAITTAAALAESLNVDLGRLEWLADCQGRERTARHEPLRHYRYRWVRKASGSLRLIESPKPRLKAIQRKLLAEILSAIPAHDAAHGFRRGRSVATFVAPHAGRRVVLKMDLRDFFPSITFARVVAIWLTAGYPEDVARMLAGLCTNSVPVAITQEIERALPTRSPEAWRARRLFAQPHLPQGAPTSPALANLCARRLDARLAGLAQASGACYTRYADDLVFSGDEEFARSVKRFAPHVAAIALEEGFTVQHRKTRIMRQGIRQQAAGAVLNAHPNVARSEYDVLKAILHNCVRQGPASQNRAGHPDFRAHLLGRIGHVRVLNPRKGQRLKRMFDRIVWR
jgi:RNA-directed DNA polymerase